MLSLDGGILLFQLVQFFHDGLTDEVGHVQAVILAHLSEAFFQGVIDAECNRNHNLSR